MCPYKLYLLLSFSSRSLTNHMQPWTYFDPAKSGPTDTEFEMAAWKSEGGGGTSITVGKSLSQEHRFSFDHEHRDPYSRLWHHRCCPLHSSYALSSPSFHALG
eukprot:TRINITY_DN2810_c0_g2_i5.p1 TRINITY_DN2810_c0_g2~~TRINITY_DN2810_c0_g2_i5.p1  ORF type:complete len:103 (-),score=1.44 TRINITY_DN2810_c0_g2_i5:148-456(-)